MIKYVAIFRKPFIAGFISMHSIDIILRMSGWDITQLALEHYNFYIDQWKPHKIILLWYRVITVWEMTSSLGRYKNAYKYKLYFWDCAATKWQRYQARWVRLWCWMGWYPFRLQDWECSEIKFSILAIKSDS